MMASVKVLLCLLLGSGMPSPALGFPTDDDNRTFEMKEMEASLAVNQLAILHLLNEHPTETEYERRSVLESEEKEEVRRLREEVATLRETQAIFLWKEATLRESLAELTTNQEAIRSIIDTIQLNVEDKTHTLSPKLQLIESNVSENQDSVHILQQEISTLKTKHDRLEGFVTTISENHTLVVPQDLEHEVSSIREDLSQHQENLAALKMFLAQSFPESFVSHEGETFFLNKEAKMSWTQGLQWCQARGGDLAHPSGDLETFKNILDLRDERVWLGASDTQREGEWRWTSGHLLPSDFPWSTGEPNGGTTENCLEIYYFSGASYNDKPCTAHNYVMCQL